MSFSNEQKAKGLATTIAQGNFSLAVQRLKEVDSEVDRVAIRKKLEQTLPKDDLEIWRRYWK